MKQVRLISGIVLSTAAVGAALFFYAKNKLGASEHTQPVAAPPAYVGAAACAECYASQVNAWKGSHHDLAMQYATERSVLGNFNNTRYEYNGVTTTFTKRDGRVFRQPRSFECTLRMAVQAFP
jgi:hypothetical protein